MDFNSQKPPQYNQINQSSSESQFIAQTWGAQPVVVQPTLRLAPDASNFGDSKMKITFFHCGVKVTIRKVEYPNPWCCYCFGCWALCCAGCQDVEHRCSKCDAIQGTYRPY